MSIVQGSNKVLIECEIHFRCCDHETMNSVSNRFWVSKFIHLAIVSVKIVLQLDVVVQVLVQDPSPLPRKLGRRPVEPEEPHDASGLDDQGRSLVVVVCLIFLQAVARFSDDLGDVERFPQLSELGDELVLLGRVRVGRDAEVAVLEDGLEEQSGVLGAERGEAVAEVVRAGVPRRHLDFDLFGNLCTLERDQDQTMRSHETETEKQSLKEATRWLGGNGTYSNHRLQVRMCVKKGSELWQGDFKMVRGLYHLKNVLESTSYLLPLVSETSFTEWYAKPSRAPILICLHCCAILACSKVGTWY